MFLIYVRDWDSPYLLSEKLNTLHRLPFIAMKTSDNMIVPWVTSQTDELSFDWESAD